jgi:rhodanese-related sulfurtransferase
MQLATDERLVREAHRTLIPSVVVSRTPAELANIASLFASSDGWIDRVRLSAEGRWYERLYQGPDYDIWVISWLIHAYSPPLSEMNEYELDGSRLIPRERVSERAETLDEQGRTRRREPVERTRASLEWRFDPAYSSRLPIATDHDIQVIVCCSEGYTSSLAAAALQDLGLWRATDLVGGFHAWRATGLPVAPPAA